MLCNFVNTNRLNKTNAGGKSENPWRIARAAF